jgi:hypothetical protein
MASSLSRHKYRVVEEKNYALSQPSFRYLDLNFCLTPKIYSGSVRELGARKTNSPEQSQ